MDSFNVVSLILLHELVRHHHVSEAFPSYLKWSAYSVAKNTSVWGNLIGHRKTGPKNHKIQPHARFISHKVQSLNGNQVFTEGSFYQSKPSTSRRVEFESNRKMLSDQVPWRRADRGRGHSRHSHKVITDCCDWTNTWCLHTNTLQ